MPILSEIPHHNSYYILFYREHKENEVQQQRGNYKLQKNLLQ
jgi:hypothetical protein